MPRLPTNKQRAMGNRPRVTRCVYCSNPADGTLHDTYGEKELERTLIVCAECHEDLKDEPDPHDSD